MVSMKSLLDCVCTEAIDGTIGPNFEEKDKKVEGPLWESGEFYLKPREDVIVYRTELLRKSDGTLYWVE